MDLESIVLESCIDAQSQKLDRLASQIHDLSQSIHSMRETLVNSIEKMMNGSVKHQGMRMNPDNGLQLHLLELKRRMKLLNNKDQQRSTNLEEESSSLKGKGEIPDVSLKGINYQKDQGTHTSPDAEVNPCIKGQNDRTLEVCLWELDKNFKLFNGNKDQQRSTDLMGDRENLDASSGKNRDVMVEHKPLIEPKTLNQMVKGTGPKLSTELGKLNPSTNESKQSSQLTNFSHRLIVTPKVPLMMHRLLTPNIYFIHHYYKESGFWIAAQLFDKSPRLNQSGETEYTKFFGVWYVVWGRKPRKPPDFMNFYGDLFAICEHKSLKPLEPTIYKPNSTIKEPLRPRGWSSILKKVVQVHQSKQICVDRDLSVHDIVMHMMRKENFLIGMLNKGVPAFPTSGVGLVSMKVSKGSCPELLQEREGAYSQLIQLQEFNKYSGKQESYGDHQTTTASGWHSCQVLSQQSSDISNSSLHIFQIAHAPSDFKDPKETECSYMPSNVSLVHLAYMNNPEIQVMLLRSVSSVINGVSLPMFRYLLSSIIKPFFKPVHQLRNNTELWSWMLIVHGLASWVVTPFRTHFLGVGGCKLIRSLQLKCFEKVVQLEMSWFDEMDNASALTGAKLSTDPVYVRSLVGDSLSLLVQNTIAAISGLIIVFMGKWQLAFVVLVLLLLMRLNGHNELKFHNLFSADTKKQYQEASEVASVAEGSFRTLPSFGTEYKAMKLYVKKHEGPRRAGIKQNLVSRVGFRSSMLFLLLLYTFSFYTGALLVVASTTTFPMVSHEFLGLSMAAEVVSQLRSIVPDYGKAKTVDVSIFDLLNQKSKLDSTDASGIMLENEKGHIEFRHVSFKYPSRPHIQIHGDLGMDIRCGHMVALVEGNGCEKWIVVSFLRRLYDTDSSNILFDRMDYQKLKVKWLRQQMGLESQDVVLFNDSRKGFIPSQLLNFRLEDKPGFYGGGIDREYASPQLYGPYMHLEGPAQ